MARVTDLDRNQIAAHRAAGRGWQTLARMYGVNEGDLRKWGEGLERDRAAVAVLARPAPVPVEAVEVVARAAKPRALTLTDRALIWLAGRGWPRFTSRELQAELGHEMKVASAVVAKMHDAGLLERVGKVCGGMGPPLKVWRVTREGRRAAAKLVAGS